jgi:ferredoxin
MPEPMGFFTDTTVCIGCKACEVACKQWNQLPADGFHWTGNSYDNTVALSDTSWRHVAFVEQFDGDIVRDAFDDFVNPLAGTSHADSFLERHDWRSLVRGDLLVGYHSEHEDVSQCFGLQWIVKEDLPDESH